MKLIAALALSCCCGNALAQEAATPGEMIGNVFDVLHLRSERAPAPDFVEQSRQDPHSLDYRPLGPAEKSQKKKTPAELDALGADLEGALERNRRAAAGVKKPDSPVHGAPRASAKKTKTKPEPEPEPRQNTD